MIETYCEYHLGDHFVHLLYLRRLAQAHPELSFRHSAPESYLWQLREVVADIPSITLSHQRSAEAINVWKNRDGNFYSHPKTNDWAGYYIAFFDELSRAFGMANPMQEPRDFLCDYPALAEYRDAQPPPFDVLVINSPPLSNQLPGFNPFEMDILVGRLAQKYRVLTTQRSHMNNVPCTQPLSISAIGALSTRCKYIVGVATGPIWPTFNIWNLDTIKLRLLLLDPERIEIAPNTVHVPDAPHAILELQNRGLL